MGNEISEIPIEDSDVESVVSGIEAFQFFENYEESFGPIEEHTPFGLSLGQIKSENPSKKKPLNQKTRPNFNMNEAVDNCKSIRGSSKERFSPTFTKSDCPIQSRTVQPIVLNKNLLVDIVNALLPYSDRNRSDLYENGNYFGSKKLELKLKQLFDADDDDIVNAIERAKRRKSPDLSVEVGVLEAKNLRAKIHKDSSNPFCIVRIAEKSSKFVTLPANSSLLEGFRTWKTEVAFETTNPCWKASFKIGDIKEDYRVIFEIWHHYNHETVLNNFKEKIPFGLPKVLKRETKNFLGCATVDLENCILREYDSWIKLSKPKEEESTLPSEGKIKKRGEIHVTIKAEKKNLLTLGDQRNFRDLLHCIACNYETNYKQLLIPWNGSISKPEKKIIDSYCAAYSISPLMLSCLWWLVICTADLCCDYKHLLSLATDVQHCLKEALCANEKETKELEDSVIYWMNLQIIKIKDLDIFFPSKTICSKEQLSYCLRILKLFEEKLSNHLLKKTLHPYNLCISEALQEYIKSWFNKERLLAHEEVSQSNKELSSNSHGQTRNPKASMTLKDHRKVKSNKKLKSDSDRKEVTTLSDFRATHLNLYGSFHAESSKKQKTRPTTRNSTTYRSLNFSRNQKYNFLQLRKSPSIPASENLPMAQHFDVDADVIALKEAAVYVDGVLNLLSDVVKIYDEIFYTQFRIPFFRQSIIYLSNEVATLLQPLLQRLYRTFAEAEDLSPKANPLALERGTPAYQLYFAIRKIEALCKNYESSSEIQLHSGFRGYWQWFSMGTKLWLRRTNLRTRNRIIAEVEDDDLKVSQEDCKYSFSAASAVEVHKMILSGWRVLQWPKEDSETEWLLFIGEVLSSLGVFYANEIKHKLSAGNLASDGNNRDRQLQICHAVNNLTMVNEAMRDLPQLLKNLDVFSDDSQSSPRADEITRLQKIVDDRRSEINCIADTVLGSIVDKLGSGISRTTADSCKLADDGLIKEFLNREVWFYRTHLLNKNFQIFLNFIWSTCLRMHRVIIEENKFKENCGFFQCLFRCFENSLQILKEEASDIQFYSFEDYGYVTGLLSHLKLTTEALIANYYFERYQEQENLSSSVKCFGDLAVRGSISWTGRLNLEVIMARNLEVMSQAVVTRPPFWRQDAKPKKVFPDTYVTVRIIPASLFSGISATKTKVMKKSCDPVFNSTFEFSLGEEKGRLDSGLVQMLVYRRGYCITGNLIGEVLLPLTAVTRIPLKAAEGSRLNCSAPTGNRTLTLSAEHPTQTRAQNLFLRITKPNELEEYASLKFLEMRKGEKTAESFLKDLKKT